MTRYLGIDYGSKRVGLAISDGLGLTARPLEVVSRSSLTDRVRQIVGEFGVDMLVVGLPTGLGGDEGKSAEAAREMGEELERDIGLGVVFVDERFSSRMAEGVLLESGMKRRQRRGTVDKVAAAIVLQNYLDYKGSPGNPGLGQDVEPPERP